MTKRNVKVIRETAQWIRSHPNEYDQSVWGEIEPKDEQIDVSDEELIAKQDTLCNSAFCIAGSALVSQGWQYRLQLSTDQHPFPETVLISPRGKSMSPFGHSQPAAQRAMGLSDDDAGTLFDASWIPLTMKLEADIRDIDLFEEGMPADEIAGHVAAALEAIADGADIAEISALNY